MFPRKVQNPRAGGAVDSNSRSGSSKARIRSEAAHDRFGQSNQGQTERDGDVGARGQELVATLPRDDYDSWLSRAVAGIGRDSYAARGAVYEREYKLLMRKLYSANPPHSDDEIDIEQRAFHNAVIRVEFGLDDQHAALLTEDRALPDEQMDGGQQPGAFAQAYSTAQDEQDEFPAPAAEPPASAVQQSRRGDDWSQGPGDRQRQMLRDPPAWSKRQTAQAVPSAKIESALEAALKLNPPHRAPDESFDLAEEGDQGIAATVPTKRQRSISGRIFRRVLVAVVLLAVGAAAYNLATGDLDLPLSNKVASGSIPTLPKNPVQQNAILFDGSRPDFNGSKFDGQVYWSLRSAKAGSASLPAIEVDLNVPGRHVMAQIAMSREPEGSSMSHLFEIRFVGENRQPDPDISNIAPIVMTSADMNRPAQLFGRVVNVTPGVFIFGLSGSPNDREQNLRWLTELPWLAIPLTYRNGAAGVLTFEKGEEGDKVLNQALSRWAGGS